MLTGIKDVNLKILSELNDRDLLNYCTTDKYAYQICQNEDFWRNRLIRKYGDKVLNNKPKDISWKNYYMQIIIDLEKYRDDPMIFFNFVIWFGNEGQSLYFFLGEWRPLLSSQEAMNNFYYLNLGKDLVIWLENGFDEDDDPIFERMVFSDITPEYLLKLASSRMVTDLRKDIKSLFIKRFSHFRDGYSPNIFPEYF